MRIAFLLLLFLVSACKSDAHQPTPLQTVTVNPSFQTQVSPVPTIAPYRCGAWVSNNTPGVSSTITIYAKLTKNVTGVAGIPATAVVHFKYINSTLDQQISDANGYVSFTIPLQDRQPHLIPAIVDIEFATPAPSVQCAAFFTPQ